MIFKVLRLLLPATALILASCASGGGSRGQTQYLEAFNPQTVPHSALYDADQVSYWDGDGMSGTPSVPHYPRHQKAVS